MYTVTVCINIEISICKTDFLQSKKQRVIGFIGCLLMGTFCFSLVNVVKFICCSILYAFSGFLLVACMKHSAEI